ncbi:MAG: MMPL family transporter, partial [Alphaproteobacteria bacterium]
MTDRNPPPSAADDPATDLYARWMAKLVDVSRRLRWPIVLLALALTVVFAQYTARNLGINSNTTDMLSKDLAFRQVYDKYKAAFPLDASNIVVVVEADSADKADDAALRLSARMAREDKLFSFVFYPEGDPFFRNNGLLYLSQQELNDLSARMADAQPFLGSIAKDPSLRGLFDMLGLALDAAAKGDIKSLALDKVLDRLSDAVEAARDGKRKQISWQEMIGGEDGKGASRRRIIVAQPQVNYGSLTPGKEVMRTIRGYAEALKLTPDTGVRVRLTGSVAINTEELDSVADGVYAASAISLALVAILLVWGLRSITLVVCALLTMLIGLIWTATFAAVSVGSLNLLSVAVAVLFIGIGIDFGVHFTLRYQEQIDRSRPHAEALRRTGAGVGGALTLSGVCAAISFYAFLPTDFRGVAELGLIAGTGMIIGTLLNLTVLPALLSILPLKASRLRIDAEGKPRRNLFHAGEQSVLRNSRAIALGALALGVASIAALPFAQFDRHPLNLKDLTTESMQALADITKDDQNSYFKAGALARDFAEAERLAAELKKLKSVGAVSTILDYIPADQDKKLEIIDDISLLLSPVLETLQPAAKLTPAGRAQALTDFRARLKQILAAAPASALAPRMARLSAALDGFAAARGTSADALAALEEDLIGLFPSRLAALRDSLKAAPVKLADLPSYLQRNNVTEDGRVKIVISPKENLLD